MSLQRKIAAFVGFCLVMPIALSPPPQQRALGAPAFEGWVRIAGADAKKPGGIYFRTSDYSNGARYENGVARFADKRDGTLRWYDPGSDTIFVGNLSPMERQQTYADVAERHVLSVDVDTLLRKFKKDIPDLKIRQTTEGGYELYHVEFAPTNRHTYYIDRTTKLIAKVLAQVGGKEHASFYYYNDPVVKDIHDIGVPRDARIVDNRPTGELKDALARLDAKIERGLGGDGGVVVVAEAIVAEDGKTVEPIGRLHLCAQAGKRVATYQYTVGSWRVAERLDGGGGGSPPIETPRTWPSAPRP